MSPKLHNNNIYTIKSPFSFVLLYGRGSVTYTHPFVANGIDCRALTKSPRNELKVHNNGSVHLAAITT